MTNILFCKTVLHFLKNWVHKLKLPPGMTSIYSSDLHRPQWPWQSYKDHIFTWMNCSWTISPNRISINVRHTSLFILLSFPWLSLFIVDIKEKKTSVHQHSDSVKLDQSITELNQCLQLSHSSLLHTLSLCLSCDLLWKFIRTGFILQQCLCRAWQNGALLPNSSWALCNKHDSYVDHLHHSHREWQKIIPSEGITFNTSVSACSNGLCLF